MAIHSRACLNQLCLDLYLFRLTVNLQNSLLCVTTYSAFVSDNSAIGAELIVAARSQGEVRLKRWFDDSITTLSMPGFCSIMLRTWLFCVQCAGNETVVLTNRIGLLLGR